MTFGRSLARTLLTGLLIVLLGWSAAGMPGAIAAPKAKATKTTQTKPAGGLAETPPPTAIQELQKALDSYQPQVTILSPKPNEVLLDNAVSVRLQVKDLPIFKDEKFGLGPHLHVLLDNRTYQAVYDTNKPLVFDNLEPGTHTIRAFASRPWHESFKNEGAYAQAFFHIFTKTQENSPDPNLPLLTYSRPQGTYGAEPIMLDFYLTNAPLHLVAQENDKDDIADWRIRCTVNGESFILERWQPVYLKGFKPGKNWVQLEFLDEKGNPVNNVFNNTARVITYEPNGKDTLARLVRGELSTADVRTIVDPDYVPPVPVPSPAPTPSVKPTSSPVPVPPVVAPAPKAPAAKVKPTPRAVKSPLKPSPEPAATPKAVKSPLKPSPEPAATPKSVAPSPLPVRPTPDKEEKETAPAAKKPLEPSPSKLESPPPGLPKPSQPAVKPSSPPPELPKSSKSESKKTKEAPKLPDFLNRLRPSPKPSAPPRSVRPAPSPIAPSPSPTTGADKQPDQSPPKATVSPKPSPLSKPLIAPSPSPTIGVEKQPAPKAPVSPRPQPLVKPMASPATPSPKPTVSPIPKSLSKPEATPSLVPKISPEPKATPSLGDRLRPSPTPSPTKPSPGATPGKAIAPQPTPTAKPQLTPTPTNSPTPSPRAATQKPSVNVVSPIATPKPDQKPTASDLYDRLRRVTAKPTVSPTPTPAPVTPGGQSTAGESTP